MNHNWTEKRNLVKKVILSLLKLVILFYYRFWNESIAKLIGACVQLSEIGLLPNGPFGWELFRRMDCPHSIETILNEFQIHDLKSHPWTYIYTSPVSCAVCLREDINFKWIGCSFLVKQQRIRTFHFFSPFMQSISFILVSKTVQYQMLWHFISNENLLLMLEFKKKKAGEQNKGASQFPAMNSPWFSHFYSLWVGYRGSHLSRHFFPDAKLLLLYASITM